MKRQGAERGRYLRESTWNEGMGMGSTSLAGVRLPAVERRVGGSVERRGAPLAVCPPPALAVLARRREYGVLRSGAGG